MKKVGPSKVPLFHQLPVISKNLQEKLKCTVFLCIEAKSYIFNSGGTSYVVGYSLSFIPGLDKSECSREPFKTWPALLKRYNQLMKRGY